MNVSTLSQSAVLQSIARVLAESVRPELVLLFGSRARGDAREDSDYDLMLVMRNDADLRDVRSQAYVVLRALGISVDVLAHTVDAYQRHQLDPGFIDWLIAREGVPVYSSGSIPQRAPSRVREGFAHEDGVETWLSRAANEIRTAELLLHDADPLVDGACFHAHAAAEKWLKALIVKRFGKYPPKTHELPKLLAMVRTVHTSNDELAEACKVLMDAYPKSRYANDRPTLEEARAAFTAAQVIRNFVMPMLEQRP